MNRMYKCASAHRDPNNGRVGRSRKGRWVVLAVSIVCLLTVTFVPIGVVGVFAEAIGNAAEGDSLPGLGDDIPSYDGTGLDSDEIKAQIDALRKRVEEYNAREAELQALLDANAHEIESVLENKAYMDEQVLALTEEIASYDSIIAEYDKLLAAKEEEIAAKQAEYDAKYKIFIERLRQTYEEGTPGILEIFFYSETFIDMLTSIERASDVLLYDKELMDQLESEKAELLAEKAVLDAFRSEQQGFAALLEERKALLNQKISESLNYAESLKGDNETYLYYIGQVEANLQIVNNEIDKAVGDYYKRLEEEGETEFFKEKEYKLYALADQIKQKMENGEIQKGSEYFEDGEEYIYPVPMTYYSLSYYTSKFGHRTYYDGEKYITSNHQGIDLGIPYNSDVYAAKSGTVIKATYQSGYGYYITIQHEDGTQTRYAHNTKNLVEVGEYVLQGEKIATVGSTGNATGNCCHFEVRINNVAKDPVKYLKMPTA